MYLQKVLRDKPFKVALMFTIAIHNAVYHKQTCTHSDAKNYYKHPTSKANEQNYKCLTKPYPKCSASQHLIRVPATLFSHYQAPT